LIGMHLLIYSKNHLLSQRGGGIKVMEKIPSWMERLLLPKLNEITGEIKAIHTHFSFTVFDLTLRAVYQTTGLHRFPREKNTIIYYLCNLSIYCVGIGSFERKKG